MKALAEFIVRGRWQAVLVAMLSGLLTFVLPPFTTPFNYLAGATVALVTLHLGAGQGLQVLVLAALFDVLCYQLLGIQAGAVLVMVLMLWLPGWMLAVVLRLSRSLDYALLAAVLFGAVFLLMVYAMFGDPAPWWVERLQSVRTLFEQSGWMLETLHNEELLHDIAALLTGVVLASVVIGVSCSLLLARWWQSVLVRPGAFREEFYRLRPGRPAGYVTLGTLLFARFASGLQGEVAAQLAMIMLVPYLLTGLAVAHSLVNLGGRSKGWLAAVYILLLVLPQASLLVAAAGLLDTWADLRRRLAGNTNRANRN